jgi:hypothetical protein
MNRMKKIRGQRRLKKRIEKWRIDNLLPNLEQINENHYDYVKIWINPFHNLRYKERNYIGPRSENRTLILNALLDIYDNWDLELKKMGIPYYLKIWLYEPRFTSSQVVCGITDRIKHYENVFTNNPSKSAFPLERYVMIKNRLDQFEWKAAMDEEIIENDFWPKKQYLYESEYYYSQRLYRKFDKRNVKKEELNDDSRKVIRYYVPKGNIWIGNKK